MLNLVYKYRQGFYMYFFKYIYNEKSEVFIFEIYFDKMGIYIYYLEVICYELLDCS